MLFVFVWIKLINKAIQTLKKIKKSKINYLVIYNILYRI